MLARRDALHRGRGEHVLLTKGGLIGVRRYTFANHSASTLTSSTVRVTTRTPRPKEGLNNPHLGRNAIGCGSKIRFEDLSER